MDNIEFYSNEEIQEWIVIFNQPENMDKIVLPNVPFSYAEIAREYIRRQNCEL